MVTKHTICAVVLFFTFISFIAALVYGFFISVRYLFKKQKRHSSSSKVNSQFDYSVYLKKKNIGSSSFDSKNNNKYLDNVSPSLQPPFKKWKTSSSSTSRLDRYYSSSTPEQLGKLGESSVSSVISAYCKRSGAYLFNNITIHFDDGTTQIDHILLTKRGILVIETKNYSGWIFGKTNDSKWTQISGRYKTVFQNPLKQNYKHCLAVRSLLPFVPNSFIKNLVVMSGDAVFKTEPPNGVVTIDKLDKIFPLINFGEISIEDFHRAVGVIEYCRLEQSEKTDNQHRDYLDRKFGNQPFYARRENFRRKKTYM
jgi:hypothetical protein